MANMNFIAAKNPAIGRYVAGIGLNGNRIRIVEKKTMDGRQPTQHFGKCTADPRIIGLIVSFLWLEKLRSDKRVFFPLEPVITTDVLADVRLPRLLLSMKIWAKRIGGDGERQGGRFDVMM